MEDLIHKKAHQHHCKPPPVLFIISETPSYFMQKPDGSTVKGVISSESSSQRQVQDKKCVLQKKTLVSGSFGAGQGCRQGVVCVYECVCECVVWKLFDSNKTKKSEGVRFAWRTLLYCSAPGAAKRKKQTLWLIVFILIHFYHQKASVKYFSLCKEAHKVKQDSFVFFLEQ
ncbi:hypothetical protein INR49_023288 [Caranx melampygus]|nr:hypothetical protein INR49_023288 [Caranx melampygus]